MLYFYPKDDTSGCTAQACEFRDSWKAVQAAGAVVLGVSPDGVASHGKFKGKYQLPFPLLADEDHAVAEAYGAWGEKSMYGRKYHGILRTTFVIGTDGRIEKVFQKVKPKGHAAEVLAALEGVTGHRDAVRPVVIFRTRAGSEPGTGSERQYRWLNRQQ